MAPDGTIRTAALFGDGKEEVDRMESDPSSRKPNRIALFREGSVRPPDPTPAGTPR